MEKKYKAYSYNLDAQASGLVGFFDSDCNYIIEEKIVKELIICNKVIVSYSNNVIKATAKIGEFKFNFNIYLQDGEGNLKRAGLFIIEKGSLGALDKDLETYLDSFVSPASPIFLEEVKKKYHLYTVDESTGMDIDINNTNLKEIIKMLTEVKRKYKAMLPLQILEEKKYIDEVLKILKNTYYGPEIIEEFKKVLTDLLINEQKNKKGKGKTVKDIFKAGNADPTIRKVRILFDKVIDKHKQIIPVDDMKKINKLEDNLYVLLLTMKEPMPELIKPPAQKKKKEEKKKDGGGDVKKKKKKGGDQKGKDKSGGGGGSKPPKTDQKTSESKTSTLNPTKNKVNFTPAKEQETQTKPKEFSMFGTDLKNKVDEKFKMRFKTKNKNTEREL